MSAWKKIVINMPCPLCDQIVRTGSAYSSHLRMKHSELSDREASIKMADAYKYCGSMIYNA
jgi:uncharacterized C2H2 Zn-finger protein